MLALLGSLASVAFARPAKQKPKKPRIEVTEDWSDTPGAKYGALTKTKCLAELRNRKIAFKEVEQARGVLAPVRLSGALGGVVYRTEVPASLRANNPNEVFDCRLVLALSDFSPILRKQSVTEALMFSAWRPPDKTWPADRIGIRHPGALAVDFRSFVLEKKAEDKKAKDLVVLRDWPAKRGEKPCTTKGTSDAEKALKAIFCEADAQRMFTSQLSPNYDADHRNHFHLEIRPGVKWRLVL